MPEPRFRSHGAQTRRVAARDLTEPASRAPVGKENRQNLPQLPDERRLLSSPPTTRRATACPAQNRVQWHTTNRRMRLVLHLEIRDLSELGWQKSSAGVVAFRRDLPDRSDTLSVGGRLGSDRPVGWPAARYAHLLRGSRGSTGTGRRGCRRRRRWFRDGGRGPGRRCVRRFPGCVGRGRGFRRSWLGRNGLGRRIGGPEVPIALRALPELLGGPRIFRSRVRQVHLGAAPLTTNADVGVVHGETDCSVPPQRFATRPRGRNPASLGLT